MSEYEFLSNGQFAILYNMRNLPEVPRRSDAYDTEVHRANVDHYRTVTAKVELDVASILACNTNLDEYFEAHTSLKGVRGLSRDTKRRAVIILGDLSRSRKDISKFVKKE